jgi:hypothetical protein
MQSNLLDETIGIVNSMTRDEIILYVSDMKKVDDPFKNSPGRKKADRPEKVQRRFRFCNAENKNHMLLNPMSFSWTKSSARKREGYPTMPLRTRKDKKAKSENGSPNQTAKAPSCTRVLVHCVMWRLWNGFKPIPDGMEISHLTGNFAVGRADLCAESGVRNKHRIGCHGKTLPGEDCKCGSEMHQVPFCNIVQVPSASYFDLTEDEEAVRDEKAALKALPSSGGKLCKACFSTIRENVDFDSLSVDELFEVCLC